MEDCKAVEILYQDDWVVVCVKAPGLSSEEAGAQGLPALLRRALGSGTVYPVHRLDRAVGGVMVYGRTAEAAAGLSRAIQAGRMEKRYLAVAEGTLPAAQGEWTDLLFHDQRRNKTFVVKRLRKGVKEARLCYRLLRADQARSLVAVRLLTGRTHQIRVQFASRQCPLVGDGRYGGSKAAQLGLWSWRLRFPHPKTGKSMTFSHLPPAVYPWKGLISEEIDAYSDETS